MWAKTTDFCHNERNQLLFSHKTVKTLRLIIHEIQANRNGTREEKTGENLKTKKKTGECYIHSVNSTRYIVYSIYPPFISSPLLFFLCSNICVWQTNPPQKCWTVLWLNAKANTRGGKEVKKMA